MQSFLSVAFALVSSLATATASPYQVDNALETRQSNNVYHVKDSYIGCGLPEPNVCSAEMTIDSDETADLPGFNAHCHFQAPAMDALFHQCDLTGATSATVPDRNVLGVYAYASLDPTGQQLSSVVISLQFSNPSNGGRTETWTGTQQGDYKLFSQDLSNYDVVAVKV